MSKRRNWTREELIVVFNLYCTIPFSKTVKTNPQVIEVANLIGRTPSAVAFKLGNFGAFDPELKKRGISGLANYSQLDKSIWEEFNSNWNDLVLESEAIIDVLKTENEIITELQEPKITERKRMITTRVNQGFFRTAVLINYDSTCCITGLNIPELLEAAHIISWKTNAEHRLNPQNGLCLNRLHHRAFDEGYFTILEDYSIKISKYLADFGNSEGLNFLKKFEGKCINSPSRFVPKSEFLEFHRDIVFKK
jgi:putative restriction endonuclease